MPRFTRLAVRRQIKEAVDRVKEEVSADIDNVSRRLQALEKQHLATQVTELEGIIETMGHTVAIHDNKLGIVIEGAVRRAVERYRHGEKWCTLEESEIYIILLTGLEIPVLIGGYTHGLIDV